MAGEVVTDEPRVPRCRACNRMVGKGRTYCNAKCEKRLKRRRYKRNRMLRNDPLPR
jgi:hypothetical protein